MKNTNIANLKKMNNLLDKNTISGDNSFNNQLNSVTCKNCSNLLIQGTTVTFKHQNNLLVYIHIEPSLFEKCEGLIIKDNMTIIQNNSGAEFEMNFANCVKRDFLCSNCLLPVAIILISVTQSVDPKYFDSLLLNPNLTSVSEFINADFSMQNTTAETDAIQMQVARRHDFNTSTVNLVNNLEINSSELSGLSNTSTTTKKKQYSPE